MSVGQEIRRTVAGTFANQRTPWQSYADASDYEKAIALVYGTARVRGKLVWMADPWTAFVKVVKEDGSILGGATDMVVGVLPSPVAAITLGFCEGPVKGFTGTYWRDGVRVPSTLALHGVDYPIETTLGPRAQTVWGYIAAKPLDPEYDVGFGGLALLRSEQFVLKDTNRLGEVSAEITGFCAAQVGEDAPADEVLVHLLEDPIIGLLPAGTVEVTVGLDGLAASSFHRWVTATGWKVSGVIEEERPLLDHVTNLLVSCNARAVWTGAKLLIVPLADIAVTGNSVTYTPPAVAAALGPADFKGAVSDEPVRLTRSPETEMRGNVPVRFQNRAMEYLDATETYQYRHPNEEVEDARPVFTDWLKDATRAAKLSSVLALQAAHSRNTAKFKLGPKHSLLQPGDLVSLTDPHSGLAGETYRVTRIERNDEPVFEVEAQEWPIGIGTFMADAAGQAADQITQPFPDSSWTFLGITGMRDAGTDMVLARPYRFGPGGPLGNDGGWTPVSYTGANQTDASRLYTATQANPYLKLEGVTHDPLYQYIVKVRFQVPTVADGDAGAWVGKLQWRTGSNAYDSSHERTFGIGAPGEWGVVEFDLRVLDDGTESDFLTAGAVTGWRLYFSSANGSEVAIDWVGFGYVAAGFALTEGVVAPQHLAATTRGGNLWPNPTSEDAPAPGESTTSPEFNGRYNAGTGAYAGAWVRRITSLATVENAIESFSQPAIPNETYALKVKGKVTSGNGSIAVRLVAYDKDGTATLTTTSTTSTSGTYANLVVKDFVIPASSVSVKAFLVCTGGASGSTVGDFDAISWKRTGEWDDLSVVVSTETVTGTAPTDTTAPASDTSATTGSVTATAAGGAGSYTYLWEKVSDHVTYPATAGSASSAATTFSRTARSGSPANVYDGYWRCKVTDADGVVKYGPLVLVRTTHLYEPV